MKLLSLSFGMVLLLFASTCNNSSSQEPQEELIEVTGTIEAIGMTSFQYGTHLLKNEEEMYALKSDKLDLSAYEGKEVKLTAKKLEGYPVDGGPDYLNVIEIKE
ncbi:hypothetical protein [Salegentibacter chungangensis]|uniref:DUF3221 domain-containing protein n=1 Tax=Salegentibacter chungangensis TaxID=1335724 RepID=A0ABW3NPI9_9FLAO